MFLAEAEAMLSGLAAYSWLFPDSPDYESFYRSSKVARMLGVDSQTVNKWCSDGSISDVLDLGGKLGFRIPRESLLIFLAERIRHPRISQSSQEL